MDGYNKARLPLSARATRARGRCQQLVAAKSCREGSVAVQVSSSRRAASYVAVADVDAGGRQKKLMRTRLGGAMESG